MSLFIPDASKMDETQARKWIEDNVISNMSLPICQTMYSRAMNGDTTPLILEGNSYVAAMMSSDTGAYVNKTILQRLKEGIQSGSGGQTNWSKPDLRLSIGSASFSWKLENYDAESKTATVTVTISDIFDFNAGGGKRSSDAEKLTAIGRRANLASYQVEVTYELKIQIDLSKAPEPQK